MSSKSSEKSDRKKFAEDFLKKWEGGGLKPKSQSALDKTLKAQEDYLKKDSENPKLWFARGTLLKENGKFEKALECFDAVIKLKPDHRGAWGAKADALASLGRFEEAAECYKKVLEISSTDIGEEYKQIVTEEKAVEKLLMEIIGDELEKKYRTELQRLNDRISKNPRDADAWFAKAEVLTKMGSYHEALEMLHEVTRLDMKYPDVWRMKGDLFLRLGDAKKAVFSYERAHELTEKGANCPLCGHQVDDDAFFCPNCGSEFDEEEEKDETEPTVRAEPELSPVIPKEPGPIPVPIRRPEPAPVPLGTLVREPVPLQEPQPKPMPVRKPGPVPAGPISTPAPPAPKPRPVPNMVPIPVERLIPVTSKGEGLVSEAPRGSYVTPDQGSRDELRTKSGLTNGATKDREKAAGFINGRRQKQADKVGKINGMINGRSQGHVLATEAGITDRTRTGHINGMVNGRGRIYGLINGTSTGARHSKGSGLPDDKGMINGIRTLRGGLTNGLTNGTGMTNGLGHPRFSNQSRVNVWKVLVIPLVALAMLIPPVTMNFEPSGAHQGINVDGDFADWDGLQLPSAPYTALNPSIDIVNASVVSDNDHLSFFVETRGPILRGGNEIVDTFHTFVDADMNKDTGYKAKHLGSDYLVTVYGKNGVVMRSQLSKYDESRGREDWNGWNHFGDIPCSVKGSKMEFQLPLDLIGDGAGEATVLFYAQSYDRQMDFSDYVIGSERGVLNIVQRSIAAEVVSGPNNPLLSLRLEAYGQDMELTELTVDLVGTASQLEISNLKLQSQSGETLLTRIPTSSRIVFSFSEPHILPKGQTEELIVVADVTGSSGNTVGARINETGMLKVSEGVESLDEQRSQSSVGYIGAVPPGIVIDGGFSDWNGSANDIDALPMQNPNVDIGSFDVVNSNGNVYFYLDVQGGILGGALVPSWNLITGEQIFSPIADSDRDTMPDEVDPYPYDFNNDLVPDSDTGFDVDMDGVLDYPYGDDYYLNVTIQNSTQFPAEYRGREVVVFIGPIVRPVLMGEDLTRIYMDDDNDSSTGFRLGALGIDHLLEIRGRNGAVSSKELLTFSGDSWFNWSWTPAGTDIDLETGFAGLEGGVDLGMTGAGAQFGTYIETTDWNGQKDDSDQVMTKSISPQEGSKATSTLIDASSDAISTSYNNQRKVVRAGDVAGDGACDATNSDGCWYDVFHDQLNEDTTSTAPNQEYISKGSKISGTFSTDIQSENGVYINYRESTDSVEAVAAYRSNTGTNTVYSPKVRTWDGSAWSSETELDNTSAKLYAVRIAWSPVASNTYIIATVGNDNKVDVFVCNPTCSKQSFADEGTNPLQVSTFSTTTYKFFDIAYEQTSGDALLVYSVVNTDTTKDLAYRTYVSGSWSNELYLDDTAETGDAQYNTLMLASKKGSDQIGLIARHHYSGGTPIYDVNAWIWSGTSWGNYVNVTDNSDSSTREREAIAWESNSGNLLAVATEGTSGSNIAYREYTGSSWSPAPPSGPSVVDCGDSSNTARFIRLLPNPAGDDMLMVRSDSSSDLFTCYWNGAAWLGEICQDGTIDNITVRAFDFAWENTGSKGLLLRGTDTGVVTYKTFTAPSSWGSNTTASMGSNGHDAVHLGMNPFPRTGATKILGAVMELTALDLGNVTWTGSAISPTPNPSLFTSDVNDDTFDAYELKYHASNDDQLTIQYNWSGVPSGDSYALKVKGYREDENISVQVLTPPSTWNTRITISATTNTLYTYNLTTSEYNSGAPSIRFVDANGTGGMQSDFWIDYASVATRTHWNRVILMRSSNTAGTSWGSQVILASGRSADNPILFLNESIDPSVAIDSAGYLHVVWTSNKTLGGDMYYVRYTKTTVTYPTQSELASSNNWESVTSIDDTLTGYMPSVSTDTGNNPHIAWSASNISGYGYYKSKYGGTWRSTVTFSGAFSGLSVDVSPQNNYVSLARLENDPTEMMIAYRAQSGSGSSYPKVRTWDGGWGGEAEQATAGSAVYHLRSAWAPSGNERIFVTMGNDGYLDAYVCDPVCSVTNNIAQASSYATAVNEQHADIAYEQNSGEALLVYTVNNTDTAKDIGYKTWDGTQWSAEQYLDDTTASTDNNYTQLVLASQKGSDKIGLIFGDATDKDALAAIWSGSAWQNFTQITGTGANMTYLSVDVAWESSSGNLLAVSLSPWNVNTDYYRWKEWTTDWGSEQGTSCADGAAENTALRLVADPVSTSNGIMGASHGLSYDLETCYWDGSSWGSKITLDENLDTWTRRPYDFAWEPSGSNGIMLFGTLSGSITYKTFTPPSTWGGWVNTSMGSDLKAWIQARTNPNWEAGEPKVYGAVLEQSTYDLGAVSWDGSSITVVGATAFSSNVGSTTWETFDIEWRSTAVTGEVHYTVCKNVASSNCDAASEFTKWDGTTGYDRVATETENASYPSLATTYEANGDLWVAYAKDVDATSRAIYARLLDYPSAGWQSAETVDSLASTVFSNPSIGADQAGKIYAMYQNSSSSVSYFKVRSSGSWGSRTQMGTNAISAIVMVRGTSDAVYGAYIAGMFYESGAKETYHCVIAEFSEFAVPISVAIIVPCVIIFKRRRRVPLKI